MSVCFSEILMSDKGGFASRFLLSGHPDEEDLRANEFLRQEAKEFDSPAYVTVQQYCFLTDADEEDANENHLALINAYNELADLSNSMDPIHIVGMFTDRNDVEHGAFWEFQMEAVA